MERAPHKHEVCTNCELNLSGASRFYKGGAIFSRCGRCGNVQPTIPIIFRISALQTRYAGAWDLLKGALTSMAPGIAALGVWEMSVAFETFKKVMENSLAQQSRMSIDPIYGAVKTALLKRSLRKESYSGSPKEYDGLKYLGWEDWLAFFEVDGKKYYHVTETDQFWTEYIDPSNIPHEEASRREEELFDSGVVADEVVKVIKQLGGPREAVNSGYLKPVEQSKTADVDQETMNQAAHNDVFVVDFDELMDLLQKVLPPVVEYSMNHKDDEALRGVAVLVGKMKEFAAENRSSQNRYPADHERTNEVYNYMPDNDSEGNIEGGGGDNGGPGAPGGPGG